jgi:Phage integrase, N-terminal SAM-like domain
VGLDDQAGKAAGELVALDAGRQTLAEFVGEWWAVYAESHLAPATLKHYTHMRGRYILPRLGSVQLRRLSPEMLHRTQTQMLAEASASR